MVSKERNRTKKRNRIKKQNAFFNCKAAFVAGISVIAVCINDVVGLIVDIPNWINICEFLFVLDKVLASEGVDKFGAYLTVFSVIEFLFERILIGSAECVELDFTLTNTRLQAIVFLSIFSFIGVVGAIYLLLYPYSKKQ